MLTNLILQKLHDFKNGQEEKARGSSNVEG
jgi:hypothetical protein